MRNRKNSTAKMHFACAIVFITITYLYLAFYQADVVAVAQHVLSDGKTDYSYRFAPVIMTLVLFLLQLGVYMVTQVRRTFHALTYFPSFLVLTFITDIANDVDLHHTLGAWWFFIPFSLLVWAGAIWVIRQLEPMSTEPHSYGWLSRYMWQNMLQLVIMIFLMTCIANNDRIFHQRMKMEHLMTQGQYEQALEVGKKSLQTDSSLMMLRVACLYETGNLGNRLFCYPLVASSKAMMPDSITVKALMWKTPRWLQPTTEEMRRKHQHYRLPADYKLCALLLDKKLDQFVNTIGKYYDIKSTKLPTHYKEALTLYTHRRAHAVIEYHDNVMDTDYQDYQQMEHKYANPVLERNAIRDTYGNTYWYYYDYANK